MTNATVEAPVTPIEPGAVDMTTSKPLTPAEMRAQVEADMAAEEVKMREAIAKKMAKRLAEIDDKIEEQALAEKRVELTNQAREFYKAVIPSLGIVIPEKGLVLKPEIKIENGPNGSLMVSYTLPEKKASTAGTGTRAARGTGSGRTSIASAKVSAYGFNGAEYKSASALLKAVVTAGDANAAFGTDNPARHIIGYARTHKDAANKITVKRADKPDMLLGDFVAAEFPVTAPAPAATSAPTTSATPPPPPVVPAS